VREEFPVGNCGDAEDTEELAVVGSPLAVAEKLPVGPEPVVV